MLRELRIQDFAVIEAATVEFGSGLNVLSGETGAGKSIIVDALTLALGARAMSDAVRTGASLARVEARFTTAPASPAGRWLAERGLEDEDLVVAREIAAEGRSRAWINGRPVTVGMLRELGDLLLEVAGQHEGQRLLQPSTHLDLLDASGGPVVHQIRAEVGRLVALRTQLRAERKALIEGDRDRAQRIDLLRYQIAEIDAAGLQAGEDETLMLRRTRLANAERLRVSAASAYGALYEGEGQAATDRLGQARGALRDGAALDPSLAEIEGRVESLAGDLADLAHALAAYIEKIEARPDELAEVEERLHLLRALRRKYGESPEAVLHYREQAVAELARLDGRDERLSELTAALDAADRELAALTVRLSAMRGDAARRLEAGVERALQSLEMARTRFIVDLARDEDPEGLRIGDGRVAVSPAGIDRVEFLLAPNPGEDSRPLARIASGGELSRIMLALRHVLAEAGGVPVLVCDEVDAGVGSRSAGAVGHLLAAVSRSRQVLCVTHLPQIASLADHHHWVVKETSGGRTRVRVRALGPQERVAEVARMLGGRRPTPIAREHAMELLARAGRDTMGGGSPKDVRGGKT